MKGVSVYSYDEKDLKVKWDDNWLLEHSVLDEQHKTIVTLLNLLFDKGYSEIQKTITLPQTINYMLHHIDTEEAFFKQCQYSHQEHHMTLHNEFRQKSKQISLSVEQNHHISDDILQFMKEWWVSHISIEDVKLKLLITTINS